MRMALLEQPKGSKRKAAWPNIPPKKSPEDVVLLIRRPATEEDEDEGAHKILVFSPSAAEKVLLRMSPHSGGHEGLIAEYFSSKYGHFAFFQDGDPLKPLRGFSDVDDDENIKKLLEARYRIKTAPYDCILRLPSPDEQDDEMIGALGPSKLNKAIEAMITSYQERIHRNMETALPKDVEALVWKLDFEPLRLFRRSGNAKARETIEALVLLIYDYEEAKKGDASRPRHMKCRIKMSPELRSLFCVSDLKNPEADALLLADIVINLWLESNPGEVLEHFPGDPLEARRISEEADPEIKQALMKVAIRRSDKFDWVIRYSRPPVLDLNDPAEPDKTPIERLLREKIEFLKSSEASKDELVDYELHLANLETWLKRLAGEK